MWGWDESHRSWSSVLIRHLLTNAVSGCQGSEIPSLAMGSNGLDRPCRGGFLSSDDVTFLDELKTFQSETR